MSNTFIYEQGWLVEKPEMDKPDRNDFYYRDLSYESDYFHKDEYNHVVKKYNDYLATLRRFKYDYPDPGKEMELGKDFEVGDSPEGWVREYYPNGDYTGVKHLEQVAIPITQRTYSEQDLLDVWEACLNYYKAEYAMTKDSANKYLKHPNHQQYFKQKFGIEIK